MIEKINTNQIKDLVQLPPAAQNDAPKPSPAQQDASLQTDFTALINQALQAAQSDEDAVQKAQELLLTGQLDTPENIRTAAENLLTFGI